LKIGFSIVVIISETSMGRVFRASDEGLTFTEIRYPDSLEINLLHDFRINGKYCHPK